MYMEMYSAVTYLGVHVLVDLCPVEHGSIVLVDVDSSQGGTPGILRAQAREFAYPLI